MLIACFKPSWASEITRRTPVRPRFTRLRRNAVQKARSSDGPTSMPEHLPIALARDADGDDRRLAHHAAIDPHLVVRGIDPQIPVLARERPRAKRRHHGIELAADARHLRLRDAVQAERLHQLVDLPRRDAVHVGFLHDRQQRVLGPPARLQQRREIRPRPHLRNRQLDRAHPRVPRPHPAPVAIRGPLGRPLVPLRPNQPGDLRFHQRLREHADALPQHIPILLLEELANERRQIHSGLRHRVNTSVSSFSGQRELTERCAMAALLSTPPGLSNFHHVRGL